MTQGPVGSESLEVGGAGDAQARAGRGGELGGTSGPSDALSEPVRLAL